MGDALATYPGADLEAPSVPTHVARARLLEAIRLLGFEPGITKHVEVHQRMVVVDVFLLDEKGQRQVAGDELATVTYRLPIVNEEN